MDANTERTGATGATAWMLRGFAPVPLRLMLGVGFLVHGYPKLFTVEGNASFVGMLTDLGVPMPELTAYAVGGLEVFGGLLLVLGVAVRPIAALGAVEMLFAGVMVHLPAGFNFLNITGTTETGALQFGMPGYEVNLLYVAGFVSLMLSGPGRLALGPAVTEHAESDDDVMAGRAEARREAPSYAG